MSDASIPDSISGDQLRSFLASKTGSKMPLSAVIPTLSFGGSTGEQGGICDLQLVVMQIIQQSEAGINLLQEFTAAVYLLHSVYESLERRRADVMNDQTMVGKLPKHHRDQISRSLDEFQSVLGTITRLSEQLHFAFVMSSSAEAIYQIRDQIGAVDEDLIRSHLLISDSLIRSLQLSRDEISEFIDHCDKPT
jgi:hypothetical protein